MNPENLIQLGLFASFALAGAVFDIRQHRIPNLLSLAFLLCGLISVLILNDVQDALSALAHCAVALVIGIALYSLKLWGGGDAKFYAATAAWFGIDQAAYLLFTVSLAGVALVVTSYIVHKVKGPGDTKFRSKELPFGVAIAVGGIVSFL